MFKTVNGFTVPSEDTECIKVVFDVSDLEPAYERCRSFEVAVQAGGNFGIWAKALSERFRHVYTFEPDPLNFSCLCRNIGDVQNIVKMQAALGDKQGCIRLSGRPENAGAHYVDGDGVVPVIRLDDLGLRRCDLIVLDIEGYEMKALLGAEKTIREHKPVIHLEDKGLSEKYGIKQGEAGEWLHSIGYELVSQMKRDFIYEARDTYRPSRR